MMITRRHTHDVTRGSNLDLLIRGFHGIGNRLVDTVGDGLEAIALALSTPQDNSAQVMEMTAKVRAVREKLKASVDAQTKGD